MFRQSCVFAYVSVIFLNSESVFLWLVSEVKVFALGLENLTTLGHAKLPFFIEFFVCEPFY